jgi:hypothetical protein
MIDSEGVPLCKDKKHNLVCRVFADSFWEQMQSNLNAPKGKGK